MSLEILKKQLSENTLQSIYVFTGKEDYLKKFYINKIKSTLNIDNNDAFNFLSLKSEGLSSLEVTDYCLSAPVFAPVKILYISCFDSDEPSLDITEAFAKLSENYPEWCVIIIDEQGTENPKAKSFAGEIIKSASKSCLKVDVPLRTTAELTSWILRHANAQGVQMSKSAAEYLLSVTDNNMYNLNNEMSKLFFADENVDEQLIDKMVIKTVDAKIFDLSDAVLAGNLSLALELFRDLYEKHPETMIMGTIYSSFSKLYHVAILKEQGLNKSEICEKTKQKSFIVNKNLELLKRISLSQLRKILALCAEADDALKRFSKDKKTDIEIFIISLINMLKN